MSTTRTTNALIDGLIAQAREIDAEYAEACFESVCTNELPSTDAQRLVRQLVATAYSLNASGLADGPDFERYIDYTNA